MDTNKDFMTGMGLAQEPISVGGALVDLGVLFLTLLTLASWISWIII